MVDLVGPVQFKEIGNVGSDVLPLLLSTLKYVNNILIDSNFTFHGPYIMFESFINDNIEIP